MPSPRLKRKPNWLRRPHRQHERALLHVIDATPQEDTRVYIRVRAITREELRAREGLSDRQDKKPRSRAFQRFAAQLERMRHG